MTMGIVLLIAVIWLAQRAGKKLYEQAVKKTDRIDIVLYIPVKLLTVFSLSPLELQQFAVNLEIYLKDSVTITPSFSPPGVWVLVRPTYPAWLASLNVFPYRKFMPLTTEQVVRTAVETLGTKPPPRVKIQGDYVIISLPPFYVPKK